MTSTDLPEIASGYGQIIYRFHGVQALGAPTMTALNAHPANPDIWDGMPPQNAMKLFLCSLDDTQWRSLTSESGLGYSNLATDTQRQLYLAIIGSSALRILTLPGPTGPWRAEDIPSYLSDLPQSRIRLGLRIRTYVQSPSLTNGGFMDMIVPGKYQVLQDYSSGQNELFGVPVREQVAHGPKPSDMDFKDKSLRANVPLDGIKTVKDLVQRIGDVIHMEIYADPHYESRSVTLIGNAAPAADLLQGLAFCVSGTYRKVGTAFVLTNDLVGIGGVRELWMEFEEEGNAMLAQATAQADATILTLPDPKSLNVLNPELAFTPQELQGVNAEPLSTGVIGVTVSFKDLSPAQQDEARKVWRVSLPPPPAGENTKPANIEGSNVELVSDSEFQLLLPSLDAPAVIPLSIGIFNARLNAQLPNSPQSAPPSPPQPTSAKILGAPYRGVLAHPKSAAEVKQLVIAMQKAHMNELWLDVFSNGQSHLDASDGSNSDQSAGGDIVQAALKATAHTAIKVYLTMDLLAWGQDAPAQDLDLTILGENTPQAIKRLAHRSATFATGTSYTPAQSTPATTGVSFFADDVSQKIKSLLQTAAREPGISGLVWRCTALPGYAVARQGLDDPAIEFGYALPQRLAFLRKWHCDPVDIDPIYPSAERADTSLPEFDDWSKQIDQMESERWNGFRTQSNTDFLRSLAGLIQKSSPAGRPLALIIQQRHAPEGGNWFAQWDAPSGSLPDTYDTSVYNSPTPQFTATNTQPPFPDWRLSFLDEQVDPASDPSMLIKRAEQEFALRPWLGWVIDLIPDNKDEAGSVNDKEADFISRFAKATNDRSR
ncbi:MAG TPA: hypothetical protein VFW40_01575 [Capsulimonadaceae bacterium]|nr:hypothetical protein [Capsulimonadaceae bacterium]